MQMTLYANGLGRQLLGMNRWFCMQMVGKLLVECNFEFLGCRSLVGYSQLPWLELQIKVS